MKRASAIGAATLLAAACSSNEGEAPKPGLELLRSAPRDSAGGVALRPLVAFELSAPLDPESVNPATVVAAFQARRWVDEADPKRLLLEAEEALQPETRYELRLEPGLRSADGLTLEQPVILAFTTAAGELLTWLRYAPSHGAREIRLNTEPFVELSQPVDPATLVETAAWIVEDRPAGVRVPATLSLAEQGHVLRFVHDGLEPSTQYRLVVTSALRSTAGLGLQPELRSVFTTGPRHPRPVADCTMMGMEGQPCDDGDACSYGATCRNGVCTPAGRAGCAVANSECAEATCEAQSGDCVFTAIAEGDPCGADDLCALAGLCRTGLCRASELVDCSAFDAPCQAAACDPGTGQCVARPTREGAPCNDSESCTFNDRCSAGVCAGTPYTCTELPCVTGGACDNNGGCSGEVAEGWCLIDGRCWQPGDDDPNSPCRSCEPAEDRRAWTPKPNGRPCDDGLFCTTGDVCIDGACDAAPRECPEPEGPCQAAACDELTGACTLVAQPEGTSCDDGNPCTVGDRCVEGVCESPAVRDCSYLDGPCSIGACDPSAGCFASPKNEGQPCDAGLCATNATCQEGRCAGDDVVDCSYLSGHCAEGVCDRSTGRCAVRPKDDGIVCDDSDCCTTRDSCSGGTCTGLPSQCRDGDCGLGYCDPESCECELRPAPDGTPCDDSVDCTTLDACRMGSCVGVEVQCNHLDSICARGVCEVASGQCSVQEFLQTCPDVCGNGVLEHGELCELSDAAAQPGCPDDCGYLTVASQTYLKADVPAELGRFGESVAVSAGFVAVGSTGDSSDSTGIGAEPGSGFAPFSGAVYVYSFEGSSWRQHEFVKATNAEADDYFGSSLSLRDEWMVVGAPFEDGSGDGVDPPIDNDLGEAGAAYVFERLASGDWQETAYLKQNANLDQRTFGSSVAVDFPWVAVGFGGSNASYIEVFKFSGGQWVTHSQVSSPSPAGESFGAAIHIADRVLAVGAPTNSSDLRGRADSLPAGDSADSGAIYIYELRGDLWEFTAAMKPALLDRGDMFGSSVATDGQIVVSGAPGDDSVSVAWPESNSVEDSGAVYVYGRGSSGAWMEAGFIKAGGSWPRIRFGASVHVTDGLIAVGAPEESGAGLGVNPDPNQQTRSAAGAVYLFSRVGSVWNQRAYLKSSGATQNSAIRLGTSVAVSSDFVVGGAGRESGGGSGVNPSHEGSRVNSGAAYIYEVRRSDKR